MRGSRAKKRTALAALVKVGIARQEEALGSVWLRLEDPFFAAWLRLFVAVPWVITLNRIGMGASWLRLAGVPPDRIQYRLGHSSITTTEVYAR